MRKDCFASPTFEKNFAMSRTLGLLTLLLVSCISWGGCEKQESKAAATDLGVINPQKDFTLHDQDGKIFHLKDHRGQIILLFFGYTSCPDVCPTTLSKLASVYSLLEPTRQKILTVFVTIDPARDTPRKLKEYLQYFNINAVGLTGTKKEIDAVVDDYKATYEKVETSSSAMGYMFDHTDYLYLIDTHGKTSYLFHPEDKPEDMVNIIKGRLLN